MIPMLSRIRITPDRHSPIRLWLPLILVWLLLAPLVIIAAPFIIVIGLARGRNPIRQFLAVWKILCASRGFCIDIRSRDANVLFEIV